MRDHVAGNHAVVRVDRRLLPDLDVLRLRFGDFERRLQGASAAPLSPAPFPAPPAGRLPRRVPASTPSIPGANVQLLELRFLQFVERVLLARRSPAARRAALRSSSRMSPPASRRDRFVWPVLPLALATVFSIEVGHQAQLPASFSLASCCICAVRYCERIAAACARLSISWFCSCALVCS